MTAPRDQAEWGLSHWVNSFLDRVMLGKCWYTAVETGTIMLTKTPEARMAEAARRKARGIKPNHLDWYVWQRETGIYAQIELKVGTNAATPGQEATMAALARNDIPHAICHSVHEVHEFMVIAGFRLHGNADNIAAECHQQYLAKRREAQAKKPARAPRKRKAAAKVTVDQAHRLGMWK
jgi:hypothetical protein